MFKIEQSYEELIQSARDFGELVRKNNVVYQDEDSATLTSLRESWTLLSQVGDKVRLENRYGAVYEFDLVTGNFTRIISDEEREDIERIWPKAESVYGK